MLRIQSVSKESNKNLKGFRSAASIGSATPRNNKAVETLRVPMLSPSPKKS